jgi:hypothetical protein
MAASQLNLKEHLDHSGSYVLYSATDMGSHGNFLFSNFIEGHVGSDGRRYLVDFGRAMPPETPTTGYIFFPPFFEQIQLFFSPPFFSSHF